MSEQDDTNPGASKVEKMNAGVDAGKKQWPSSEAAAQAGAGAVGSGGASDQLHKADSAERPALGHPSYESLEAQLTEAEQKLNDHWNEVMRARAEMENTRRRAAKDVESARKYALEKFTNDLLPVADSLGHALQCEYGDNQFAKSIHEGVDMTMNMLLQTLERYGVKQIDPVMGAVFDPLHHQAVSTEAMPDVAPNSVVRVLQKGYLLNERLIRPAMVIVAK